MKKALLAVGLLVTFGVGAHAADKYWDVNGTTAGAGGPAATGTWSAAGTTWNTDSAGVAAPGAWVANDVAIFSAGADATGAYEVTLSGTHAAGGITVEEGAPSFVGTGAVTLGANDIVVNSGATLSSNSSLRISTTAGSTVTLNGGTLQTTNPGAAGTFFDADSEIILGVGGGTLSHTTANILSIVQTGTRITGNGSLTKSGAGVLAIASAAGNNTYSGGTIVNEGELRMRTVVNTLPVTTAVTVNSPGIFNLNGVNTQIGSLTGDGNVGTGAGTLTIDGSASTSFNGALKNIANAGASGVTTGNGRLIKNGSGVITFNGLNDINGSVTLNAGGIIVSSGASLSGSIADLNVNGGTLTLNNAAQTIENLASTTTLGIISLGNGHVLTTDPVASTTYSGTITGAGGLVKANALSGTRRTLTLSGDNNYDGNTVVTGGLISVAHANALGSTSGYTEVNATSVLGAEVLFTGVGGSVTTNEPFRLSGAGSSNGGAISVLAGATPTISGPVTLIGETTLTVSGTSGVTYNNANAITSASNQNLTLQGGAPSTGTGGTISGVINLGTGSLTKAQGGTWTLSSPTGNSYSGGTIINSGTIYANNTSGSALGTGAVTVIGGTLGGTGSIAGAVTVNSGGSVSPGMSVESLEVGSLTFNNGSSFVYEIDSAAGTADLVTSKLVPTVSTGDLNIDTTENSVVTLARSDLAGTSVNLAGTKFTLINYEGAWNGGTFAGLPDGGYIIGLGLNDWQINYADSTPGVNNPGGTGMFVTITAAVPEASSVLFGALASCVGAVAYVVRRRRK